MTTQPDHADRSSQAAYSPHARMRVKIGPLLLVCWLIVACALVNVISTRMRFSTIDCPDHIIDPNVAPWWELTMLPDIGPEISRRIVQYRRQRKTEAGPTSIVFRSIEDLDAVPGIGPKTMDRLRPHLRFDSTLRLATGGESRDE